MLPPPPEPRSDPEHHNDGPADRADAEADLASFATEKPQPTPTRRIFTSVDSTRRPGAPDVPRRRRAGSAAAGGGGSYRPRVAPARNATSSSVQSSGRSSGMKWPQGIGRPVTGWSVAVQRPHVAKKASLAASL